MCVLLYIPLYINVIQYIHNLLLYLSNKPKQSISCLWMAHFLFYFIFETKRKIKSICTNNV